MYTLSVQHHIDAAHALRGYKGKCEALHGHRFQVAVKVEAGLLDNIGLACDFTELKSRLKDVLAPFDHVCLNDTPPFDKINPSSENIARTIYDGMKKALDGMPAALASVTVWESPDKFVEYTER